jgi:DNA-directed RNA polymerase subunit RPC12/RpoP
MAIRCSHCSREFDVTLFEFERTITCMCGNVVTLQHKVRSEERIITGRDEEKRISEIRTFADNIAYLIVSTDYPKIDIEIEKIKLKEKVQELFPDRIHLYHLIYEPRFRRLEEQFRNT